MARLPRVMPRANFKPVQLSTVHQRMWEETLATCNWVAPGFIHITYSMLVPKGRTMAALFTEDMSYQAATDGYQLIFKPSRFFTENNLLNRVFIVCHEVMHNIWDHCGMGFKYMHLGQVTWEGVSVPYYHPFANWIQDHIINHALLEARIGEFKPGWICDPEIASQNDSWVERYVKLWKECEQQCKEKGRGGRGRGKGDSAGGLPDKTKQELDRQMGEAQGEQDDPNGENGPAAPRKGQFDLHCDPDSGGKTGEEDAPSRERSEVEWQQAVAAGMAVAKAQGKLPANLELVFGKILEPTVHWAEHIRAWLARKVGSGGYNWQRPDRRLIVRDIVAPGRTGHGAKLVVIGGDNSGSIYADPTLLGRWLGEVGGILEDVNPEKIILIWCDATVQQIDEIEDVEDIHTIQKKGSKGGGGTDFRPVFAKIDEMHLKPDAFVYLTDMMGTFPKEAPDYPVIWGTITPIEQIPPPFGDAVFIPTHPET